MGTVISYILKDTGRNDDPDPTTGLTSRDRNVLKATWKKITREQAGLNTGISIFLNLFEKYPEYKQLFPFRDIPHDQLRDSNRFRAHCISLIYAFTSIVDSIESPALLEQLLAKQGTNHVPRNVPDHAYWELKKVLLELFASSMNEVEVKTWDKFLDLGFGIMINNADDARKNLK